MDNFQPPLIQRPKILVVLHQQNSIAGRLGNMLIERGFDLDIRRPPLGHPLPDTLELHAGAIVFGGPMSANDNEEYINREIDWLSVPLKEKQTILRNLLRRANVGAPFGWRGLSQ